MYLDVRWSKDVDGHEKVDTVSTCYVHVLYVHVYIYVLAEVNDLVHGTL